MVLGQAGVPPLVLTRSGSAGRAFDAPLSLLRNRLPVRLWIEYMTAVKRCQDKS